MKLQLNVATVLEPTGHEVMKLRTVVVMTNRRSWPKRSRFGCTWIFVTVALDDPTGALGQKEAGSAVRESFRTVALMTQQALLAKK